jgi:hypothetical protein
MKAEHRKELRTNVLYERLTHLWQDLKAGPNTTTIVICLVILLIAGAVIAWRLVRNSQVASQSAAWVKVYNADNIEQFQEVAKENASRPPALAARFEGARAQLRHGLEKLAANDEKERGEAAEKVKSAGELYAQLVNDAKDYPLLVQEALMGAAKARESQGDLDGALNYYRDLAGRKPESDLTRQAQQSAKDLDDPATREKIRTFYDELKKQLTAQK